MTTRWWQSIGLRFTGFCFQYVRSWKLFSRKGIDENKTKITESDGWQIITYVYQDVQHSFFVIFVSTSPLHILLSFIRCTCRNWKNVSTRIWKRIDFCDNVTRCRRVRVFRVILDHISHGIRTESKVIRKKWSPQKKDFVRVEFEKHLDSRTFLFSNKL